MDETVEKLKVILQMSPLETKKAVILLSEFVRRRCMPIRFGSALRNITLITDDRVSDRHSRTRRESASSR
jgi:hypothetical protein